MSLREIVDKLSKLTVLEAAELSKMLEEEWGVSAATPTFAAVGAMPGAGQQEQAEEKTEFDVVLTGATDEKKKLSIIKALRAVNSSLNLTDAKSIVEKAMSGESAVIAHAVSKDEAEKIKKTLEADSAKVEIK